VCRASVEQADNSGSGIAANQDSSGSRSTAQSGGLNAVWSALRSVMDPGEILNQGLRVEDRQALMQLSIRELRERARARNITLRGAVEKSDIVDLLLGERLVVGFLLI